MLADLIASSMCRCTDVPNEEDCEYIYRPKCLLRQLCCLLGLKHVCDEQKTHKNPALRSQTGPSKDSPSKGTSPSSAAPTPAKKASPVLELEGKKWRVVSLVCFFEFSDCL